MKLLITIIAVIACIALTNAATLSVFKVRGLYSSIDAGSQDNSFANLEKKFKQQIETLFTGAVVQTVQSFEYHIIYLTKDDAEAGLAKLPSTPRSIHALTDAVNDAAFPLNNHVLINTLRVDMAPDTPILDLHDTCFNGAKDGNETDIDCGGGDCLPCRGGKQCENDADCADGGCYGDETEKYCEDMIDGGMQSSLAMIIMMVVGMAIVAVLG